jgi:hypothetical protein
MTKSIVEERSFAPMNVGMFESLRIVRFARMRVSSSSSQKRGRRREKRIST